MTRPVERSELVDYQTYEELRPAIRQAVMKVKEPRRIHIGPHLTFLFENHATMRYQVQEMMRAEQIVRFLRWMSLFRISKERLEVFMVAQREDLDGILDEVFERLSTRMKRWTWPSWAPATRVSGPRTT